MRHTLYFAHSTGALSYIRYPTLLMIHLIFIIAGSHSSILYIAIYMIYFF